jgi:hypothetical protein
MLRFVPLTFKAKYCCPKTPSPEVHKYIVKPVLGFYILCEVMNTEGSPDARNSEVLLAFKVAEFQIALGMACWLVGNKPPA